MAMRLAWLCGKRHYSDFRVYVSLANNWNELHANPLRLYHGRDIIDHLGVISARDGDSPGTWRTIHTRKAGCRTSGMTAGQPLILPRRKLLIRTWKCWRPTWHSRSCCTRGTPRRIVFSEQGFNSENGPLRDAGKQAAAGYVLEYLKARNMKTVDMMANHSYLDNLHEFGLNLGIFRYDPDAPHRRGGKPIAAAVKAMDTPEEEIAILFAREIISAELFDYLLHPPPCSAGTRTAPARRSSAEQIYKKQTGGFAASGLQSSCLLFKGVPSFSRA